jgi:hypothetical protein
VVNHHGVEVGASSNTVDVRSASNWLSVDVRVEFGSSPDRFRVIWIGVFAFA